MDSRRDLERADPFASDDVGGRCQDFFHDGLSSPFVRRYENDQGRAVAVGEQLRAAVAQHLFHQVRTVVGHRLVEQSHEPRSVASAARASALQGCRDLIGEASRRCADDLGHRAASPGDDKALASFDCVQVLGEILAEVSGADRSHAYILARQMDARE